MKLLDSINNIQRKMACLLLAMTFVLSVCANANPGYISEFDFTQGLKSIDIKVDQHCTYEIGILFKSNNGNEKIKDTFGNARKINLPATVDITLKDAAEKVRLSILNFGGDIPNYRYGPNPLKLIAGKIYLEPGEYIATVDIKEIFKDLSPLHAALFVSTDPKVTCKRSRHTEQPANTHQ